MKARPERAVLPARRLLIQFNPRRCEFGEANRRPFCLQTAYDTERDAGDLQRALANVRARLSRILVRQQDR